jgi:hypothetical protein
MTVVSGAAWPLERYSPRLSMILTVMTTLHAGFEPPLRTVPVTRTPPTLSTIPSFVTVVTRTLAPDAASGVGVAGGSAPGSGVAAGADDVDGVPLIVPSVPFPFAAPASFRSRAKSWSVRGPAVAGRGVGLGAGEGVAAAA